MKIALALSFAGLLAGSAAAQYTKVKSPPGSELSHASILSSALGESFSSSGSRDYASDSFYADRVNDRYDQTWDAGTYNATIIGKQAGYTHDFGYIQNGSFEALLDTSDIGSSASVTVDSDFQWAIDVDNTGAVWSSKKYHNSDWKDHMVTYKLYENDHFAGFAIFFEDLPKWCWDRDYNDAAVLLTLVPTPQTAGLALVGLGGVGFAAGRRRRD